MRVLIDTHIFLWIFLEPQRIPIEAERFLQNTSENEIFISHASAWEIAIKFGTGKLKIPETPDIFVPDRVRRAGYLFLPIELRHVSNVYNLPPIHKDPFDRLLISQAKIENLALITADPHFSLYKIKTLSFNSFS